MNRVDVKVLMIRNGISVATLSRKLEVTPQMIYDVMASRRNSKRIEHALEGVFGISISELRKAWQNEDFTDSKTGKDLLSKFQAAGIAVGQ